MPEEKNMLEDETMSEDKTMSCGTEQSTSCDNSAQDSCCPPERNTTPFVRGGQKVGRNDPCPCGSGKKYKQCHGR